ncbi:MAG TPA: response regulator [bacterium]|nr:response regulator [bacterium]
MVSQPKKILIVEDEKPLARALELKLLNSGFRPRIAVDGQEALDYLKKEKFDLMLLDLVMPNISGFDVLEKMSAGKNKTPVIVTSNLGQEEDLKKVEKFGIKKYFIKSDVSIVDIINYIKDILK